MRDAVQPAVQGYLESLQAEAASWQICTLREQALALARDASETAWIKKVLHAPTVDLRRGVMVDTATLLQGWQEALEQKRINASHT